MVKDAAWDKKYSLQIRSRQCKHTPHMQHCRQTCRHMCEIWRHVGNPGADHLNRPDPTGQKSDLQEMPNQHSSFPYQLPNRRSRQHMWTNSTTLLHTQHSRGGSSWHAEVDLLTTWLRGSEITPTSGHLDSVMHCYSGCTHNAVSLHTDNK